MIALTVSIFFLYRKMVHPTYMWAVRRYIPVVLPAFIIFISYALFQLTRHVKKAGKPIAICCICVLAAYTVIKGGQLILHTEYKGTVDFCERRPNRRGRVKPGSSS